MDYAGMEPSPATGTAMDYAGMERLHAAGTAMLGPWTLAWSLLPPRGYS